mmetsp:Transcript_3764/g.14749  ORF Transcript_3764/g.14749 Transcript_3764/m.14749 type:complete len:81 (+) Transcript_3764:970-1212(+)
MYLLELPSEEVLEEEDEEESIFGARSRGRGLAKAFPVQQTKAYKSRPYGHMGLTPEQHGGLPGSIAAISKTSLSRLLARR